MKLLAFVIALYGGAALAGECQRTAATCVDAMPCKTISGVSVCLADIGETCWDFSQSYRCASSTLVDDCQELEARGCSQTGSKCIEETNAACTLYEQTYRCVASPARTSSQTQCGTQTYCVAGNCTDTSHTADSDFGRTVAVMEAQRQASVYSDANALDLFRGVSSECSKKLGGMGNCCKKNSGGQSNNVLAQAAVQNVASNAGGYLLNKTANAVGSTYMYDSLFQSDAPDWALKGFESIFGAGGGAAGGWAPSLNFMGLGVTFGGAAPAGSTVLSGLSSQTMTVYFNPATFYLAIAMMVIQELLSCEDQDQVLAMKRGANLCTFVGSYCSSKLLGSCMATKESYCCFNSRLARIVNEQGRAQIGRTWGSAQSPDCRGFAIEEIERLDFSKMDLSEFYAEIAPSLPDAAGVKSRAATYDISPLKSRTPSYYNAP